MSVFKNIFKSLLLMVIISVVLSAIFIISSLVWGAGSNIAHNSSIGTYTGVLLLLIITRCLPMVGILIIMHIIGSFLLKKYKLSIFTLMAIFSVLYIVMGLGLFGGNFWQLHNMYTGDFKLESWFKSEQKDIFFSISSLFGTIYFIWKSFYSDQIMQRRQS